MHIALVCPYDLRRPGGVRTHIFGLAKALVGRGHRPEIIAPLGGDSETPSGVLTCGTPRAVSFGGTRIDVTWSPWSRVREVAADRFDVMHFHTLWNPFMPLQLAAAFRGPKVATFHDVPGPQTPWIARAAMAPAAELLNALFLRRVIAVSPVVSEYLRGVRHVVIPNGITLPKGEKRPNAPGFQRQNIVYVGRLEPRKGVDTLLRAMAHLGADAPPLRIVGDGGLRLSLELFAKEQGLSQVTFVGEVEEHERFVEVMAAELLIAPSLGGESFGIVLTEAMAAGAVPIASDIPGYRHVLAGMAPELTFPAGDSAALAKRIRALFGNAGKLGVIREWAHEHVRQFDWVKLAERVERVYADAIRG